MHATSVIWSLYLNCYTDGAALFYTSVKEDKNCDLLHRYLTHRIYGFPFNSPAYVVEKDSVFVWVYYEFKNISSQILKVNENIVFF